MTTEMQEIAITEEKPLLTGQAEAKVSDDATHPHTHTYAGGMYILYRQQGNAHTHQCSPRIEKETRAPRSAAITRS